LWFSLNQFKKGRAHSSAAFFIANYSKADAPEERAQASVSKGKGGVFLLFRDIKLRFSPQHLRKTALCRNRELIRILQYAIENSIHFRPEKDYDFDRA